MEWRLAAGGRPLAAVLVAGGDGAGGRDGGGGGEEHPAADLAGAGHRGAVAFFLDLAQEVSGRWQLTTRLLEGDRVVRGPVLSGGGVPPRDLVAAWDGRILHLVHPRENVLLYRTWSPGAPAWSGALHLGEGGLPRLVLATGKKYCLWKGDGAFHLRAGNSRGWGELRTLAGGLGEDASLFVREDRLLVAAKAEGCLRLFVSRDEGLSWEESADVAGGGSGEVDGPPCGLALPGYGGTRAYSRVEKATVSGGVAAGNGGEATERDILVEVRAILDRLAEELTRAQAEKAEAQQGERHWREVAAGHLVELRQARRDRDLALRDKEAALRDKEAALRDKDAALLEREEARKQAAWWRAELGQENRRPRPPVGPVGLIGPVEAEPEERTARAASWDDGSVTGSGGQGDGTGHPGAGADGKAAKPPSFLAQVARWLRGFLED
jgi:hypothetical protein